MWFHVVKLPRTPHIGARAEMQNSSAVSALWQIVTGRGCELSRDGRCVTDGPGPYRSLDDCSVIALQPFTISMATYHVEARFDYLSIRNVAYRSEQYPRGPDGVSMLANDEMRWITDHTITSSGFEACAFPVEWEGGSANTQSSFFNPYWIFFGPMPCLIIFILVAFRLRTRRQMAWDRRLAAQNMGSIRRQTWEFPERQEQRPPAPIVQGRPVASAVSVPGLIAGVALTENPIHGRMSGHLTVAHELNQLAMLHAAGHISTQEFDAAKARLLGMPVPDPPAAQEAMPTATGTVVGVPVRGWMGLHQV